MSEVSQFFDEFSEDYDKSAFFKSEGTRWLSEIETGVMRGLHVEGALVLDAGVGTGRNAALLSEKGARVVGIDISPSMLKKARRVGCEVVLASAHMLPFRQGVFDVVVCVRVLKYLEHWRGVISEDGRVLKGGGSYVLEVANLRSAAALKKGNYRLFSLRRVVEALEHDFVCERRVCGSRLPFPLYMWLNGFLLRIVVGIEALLNRLLPKCALSRSVLFVCRRR
ncbi:MAG: class I SAM-dependent methyltransferase [Methermicoccaceae archaeon]